MLLQVQPLRKPSGASAVERGLGWSCRGAGRRLDLIVAIIIEIIVIVIVLIIVIVGSGFRV